MNQVMNFRGMVRPLKGQTVWGSAAALLLAAGTFACSSSDQGASPTPGAGNTGSTAGTGTGGAGNPGNGGSNPGAGAGGINGVSGMSSVAGNGTVGGTSGDPNIQGIVPLFGPSTKLEPAVLEERPDALVTHWSDRARDRHARERKVPDFNKYEHYLHIYWEKRTAEVEIIDTIGKGGTTITFNVKSGWKLDTNQAELRFFFRGIGTVAEYSDNRPMTQVGSVDDFTYTHVVKTNATFNRPLQVGDKMEFELSQFLDKNYKAAEFTGRDNYYGTTMLYIVGKGLVPWAASGKNMRPDSNPEPSYDSEMIPESAWLGGLTTVHRTETLEKDKQFLQMALNMNIMNGNLFMQGRRAIHTNFDDGHHDESPENPFWNEQKGKLGPLYINHSCNQCHVQNGRAVPPAVNTPLKQYVFKVGTETGEADPKLGHVLQPSDTQGSSEAKAVIASWTETDGLRKPVFAFNGGTAPTHYSPRVSPQLVGLGLLEAIPETAVAALADPNDSNGDGISGRMRVLTDPVTGEKRLGRFGWKAGQARVKHQVAAALNTDMGVHTSIFPKPDCGSAQTDCGTSGMEFIDKDLDNLSLYVSLLGIRPQRDWAKAEVIKGREVFTAVGCASCHTPSFETSVFAEHAELRKQKIQPFTDLLLHDMGPGLADTLPEGEATYLEWRTPPLWSIGFTADVSGQESYLHDGRARTLAEAILWHGGEGEKSKNAFKALPEADKNALVAFLKSL
jgi:CxxC motif-containing protein (DUF1111 family)